MDEAISILELMYERYIENYRSNGRNDFDSGRVDALKNAIEELLQVQKNGPV